MIEVKTKFVFAEKCTESHETKNPMKDCESTLRIQNHLNHLCSTSYMLTQMILSKQYEKCQKKYFHVKWKQVIRRIKSVF